MNSRSADLVAASATAGAAAAAAAMHPSTQGVGWLVLAVATGLPLAFIVPGYALTAALFVSQATKASVRVLLSVALSIAACILGGLLLDALPAGLHRDSWATLLLIVTVGAAVTGIVRRRKSSDSWLPARNHVLGPQWVPTLASVAIAAVAFTGALVLSHASAQSQPQAEVTQLSAVSRNISTTVTELHLAASTDRDQSQAYLVRLAINDGQTIEWRIQLGRGMGWQQQWAVPRYHHVRVTLSRASTAEQPVRSVEMDVS